MLFSLVQCCQNISIRLQPLGSIVLNNVSLSWNQSVLLGPIKPTVIPLSLANAHALDACLSVERFVRLIAVLLLLTYLHIFSRL